MTSGKAAAITQNASKAAVVTEDVGKAAAEDGAKATRAIEPERARPASEVGSTEHRAMRWKEHQERGGTWDYDRWSKTYDNNLVRATEANKAVDAYQQLGWGRRESRSIAKGFRAG